MFCGLNPRTLTCQGGRVVVLISLSVVFIGEWKLGKEDLIWTSFFFAPLFILQDGKMNQVQPKIKELAENKRMEV